MATRKGQCDQFHDEIKAMIGQGMTNPEIASELNVSRNALAIYVQKKLGGNDNYIKRKTKHKHLRKKVLELNLKMSNQEIAKKLNLTKSELKSCFTIAYMDQDLKHLRKDSRRRDPWSTRELRFLLRWSGVISQSDINEYLKRGKGRIVIKEKLQELGLCSKNVNGMTLSQFRALFKKEPVYILETWAGSPSSKFLNSPTHFKIIPWIHIDEMIKDGHIDTVKSIAIYVEAMAMFQEWIHGKNYWESLTSAPYFKAIHNEKRTSDLRD